MFANVFRSTTLLFVSYEFVKTWNYVSDSNTTEVGWERRSHTFCTRLP